ncbi:hypothetical protein AZE42_10918 [Rhizopogon vesiculosus]|uniref:Uncharacterized protein n=1 Tax=Rhizopogon vesiculosus TaxID=180088 RepID=A0A1J8Q0L3_9AGAM|nr:hypothetical protein AZE42_10918 [Rhizopogon vesiculosus]
MCWCRRRPHGYLSLPVNSSRPGLSTNVCSRMSRTSAISAMDLSIKFSLMTIECLPLSSAMDCLSFNSWITVSVVNEEKIQTRGKETASAIQRLKIHVRQRLKGLSVCISAETDLEEGEVGTLIEQVKELTRLLYSDLETCQVGLNITSRGPHDLDWVYRKPL